MEEAYWIPAVAATAGIINFGWDSCSWEGNILHPWLLLLHGWFDWKSRNVYTPPVFNTHGQGNPIQISQRCSVL